MSLSSGEGVKISMSVLEKGEIILVQPVLRDSKDIKILQNFPDIIIV